MGPHPPRTFREAVLDAPWLDRLMRKIKPMGRTDAYDIVAYFEPL